MVELNRHPYALPYCMYRVVSRDTSSGKSSCVFENEEKQVVVLIRDDANATLRILEGTAAAKADAG